MILKYRTKRTPNLADLPAELNSGRFDVLRNEGDGPVFLGEWQGGGTVGSLRLLVLFLISQRSEFDSLAYDTKDMKHVLRTWHKRLKYKLVHQQNTNTIK